jgi:hypothetical protein
MHAISDSMPEKSFLFLQIVLYRYQEVVDVMTEIQSEAELHGQSKSFWVNDTKGSNNDKKAKISKIRTKYEAKIATAEQELLSLTLEKYDDDAQNKDSSMTQTVDDNASESKAAIRYLAYETELARERIKAEEARDLLWTAWSAAAERNANHHPKEQSIATALNLALTCRRKFTSAVQSYMRNEAAECPNARVPAWLSNEPAWPADLKHDAWWPMKTAPDSEKTLVALLESADRAVSLAEKMMYCENSPQQKIESRGKGAFIAARDAQQGSAKVIAALIAAAKHLKQLSGPVRQ